MRYTTVMNHPKANELDYINFLVATPKAYSCLEAGRVQPDSADTPAHDALTRLLHRLDPDPIRLWDEAAPHVRLDAGLLIVDDTTLDKPYARMIEPVRRHWSGKHHLCRLPLPSAAFGGFRAHPCHNVYSFTTSYLRYVAAA